MFDRESYVFLFYMYIYALYIMYFLNILIDKNIYSRFIIHLDISYCNIKYVIDKID